MRKRRGPTGFAPLVGINLDGRFVVERRCRRDGVGRAALRAHGGGAWMGKAWWWVERG